MNNKPERRALSLRVEEAAQEVNAVLLSALAAGATWFAPLPEAVMTAGAIQQIFGLPVLVSAAVAASLELIGVSANAAYNDAKEYNAQQWVAANGKRLQNPRNPLESERRPLWLLGGFYATTTAIVWSTAVYNVVIEGAPLIRLLACLFPFASGIGVMVANQRASLRRKVAQERIEAAEAKTIPAPVVVKVDKPEIAPAPVVKPLAPLLPINAAEWRELAQGMNGDRPLDGDGVNQWLENHGYEPKPATTARRWARMATEAEVLV